MKRLVKEGNYRGEWLALALEYSEKAFDYLKRAASAADEAEYSNFFEELKSHADNVKNTLYDLRNIVDGLSKEDPVSESIDDGGWFDDRGDMIKTLPGDCILACSGQGRVDDDVSFWVDELGFADDLPRELAINYLKEYGAWEEDELNDMTLKSLAEKVL